MKEVLEQGTESVLGLSEGRVPGPQTASVAGPWGQPFPGMLVHDLRRLFPKSS